MLKAITMSPVVRNDHQGNARASTLTCCVGMALAALCLTTDANAQGAARDVTRDAPAVVDADGVREARIRIKNMTGQNATDVTVSLSGGGGARITVVDIQGTERDFVDDNNDGRIGDGENDTTYDNDDDPGTVVKSILTGSLSGAGGRIARNEEREIVVRFDGPLPDGARIRIRLSSTADDGTHVDMCAYAPLDPMSTETALVSVGSAAPQIATGVVNMGDEPIEGIQLFDPGSDPFEWWWPPLAVHTIGGRDTEWWLDDEGRMNMVFGHPVLPGELVEFGLSLSSPVYPHFGERAIGFRTMPQEPCYADFDGDGRLTIFDFLAYQNAFLAGDPRADCDGDGRMTIFDFLCFQNAFLAGCG